MSVDLEVGLDWELLTSEMEAPHCESPHHVRFQGDSHDDGPATHYMLIGHGCYGPVGQVIPVCVSYVAHWTRDQRIVFCSHCGLILGKEELNKVLGPINA
jgi:hypothetical protein